MAASSRFRINSPTVISETIDGETVIVDFETGNYYSLDLVGASVWDLIAASATVEEMIDTLAGQYLADQTVIAGAVHHLLAELQDEQLIAPYAPDDPAGLEQVNPRSELPSETAKRPFDAPMLHKYTDMQELLLLDPIHEVDDAGWPLARPDMPDRDR